MVDFLDGGPVEIAAEPDSSQWCEKHAPPKPGLCVIHGVELHELHSKEIGEAFGVEAIFYCPKFGCDNFSWDSGSRTTGISIDPVGYFMKRHKLNPWLFRAVIEQIFESAARQRILFVQQHKLIERLEKAGIFEGGKKT